MRQCDGHFAIAWGKCDETKSLELGPDEISSSLDHDRATGDPRRAVPRSAGVRRPIIFAGFVSRAHSIARPLTPMGAHPMPSKQVSRKGISAKGHRRPSKEPPRISPSPSPRRPATRKPAYHSLARTRAAPRPICPPIHWSPTLWARTSLANTDVLVREHITWSHDQTERSSVVSTGWLVPFKATHPNPPVPESQPPGPARPS